MAKATGKPIIIHNEETTPDQTTTIQYNLLEDQTIEIPLDFFTISLWLAVTSIILLITAQLVQAYDGPQTLLIDSKKLKAAAFTMGTLFLSTVAIHIYTIITTK